MNVKFIFILYFLLALVSCSAIKNNDSQKDRTSDIHLLKKALTIFSESDSVQLIRNDNNSFCLFLKESKINAGNPRHTIRFAIFDMAKDKIVYENRFDNSSIKWYANDNLLLTRYLGIIENPTISNIKYFVIKFQSNEIIEISSPIINP